jgi:hypothetical protein
MPALSTTPPLVVYVVRKAKAEIVSQKPAATLWQLAAAAIVVSRGCMLLQKFRQRSADLDRTPRLGGCANQRPVEETIHPRL